MTSLKTQLADLQASATVEKLQDLRTIVDGIPPAELPVCLFKTLRSVWTHSTVFKVKKLARSLHARYDAVARKLKNLPPKPPFGDDTWWTFFACPARDPLTGRCPSRCGPLHAFLSELNEEGVATLPHPTLTDPAARKALVDPYMDAVRKSPEWATPLKRAEESTAGGFAGSASIAGFFSPAARKLMIETEEYIAKVVLGNTETPKLWEYGCTRIDRVRINGPSTGFVTAEGGHRDLQAPGGTGKIVTLGGWLNLSETDQMFTVAKRTHKTPEPPGPGGFAKIAADEVPAMTQVVVKPGCYVVFFGHIVHCVTKAKFKELSPRVHVGFSVADNTAAIPQTKKRKRDLDTQEAVPDLKSGQACAWAPRLYRVNWLPKFVKHAKKLKTPYCSDLPIGSGQHCVKDMPAIFRDAGVTDDEWQFDEATNTVVIKNGAPGHKKPSYEGGRVVQRYVAKPLMPADAFPPLAEGDKARYFLRPLSSL
tara:strand:+ start:17909 stop:19348 length:1440 start_codon:yes stop_codon:yes gene_type:complete